MNDRELIAKLKREYAVMAEEIFPAIEVAPRPTRRRASDPRIVVFCSNLGRRYQSVGRAA
jgi:hypothetical protein